MDNGDEVPGRRPASGLDRLLATVSPEASPATAEAAGAAESAADADASADGEATVAAAAAAAAADDAARARKDFARLLGDFRRTAVLVPFDEHDSLWTADFGGVRWICAFSDEAALADFARARGEAGRVWPYRTVLGARLLDVLVPMLPGPAGVALDAAAADGCGMLFPPVAGIVPDAVAVDLGGPR